MRSLGLDIGERRIGVALSDPLGIYAFPLETLRGIDSRRLREYVEGKVREGVTTAVVGLPLTMSGREGREAERVRRYAEELRSVEGLTVVIWDERLSTVEAERRLKEVGSWGRGRRADAEAAAVVLQSYLDAQRTARDKDDDGEEL